MILFWGGLVELDVPTPLLSKPNQFRIRNGGKKRKDGEALERRRKARTSVKSEGINWQQSLHFILRMSSLFELQKVQHLPQMWNTNIHYRDKHPQDLFH